MSAAQAEEAALGAQLRALEAHMGAAAREHQQRRKEAAQQVGGGRARPHGRGVVRCGCELL